LVFAHAETKLKLQNIKNELVNSKRARQEANLNRVLLRPPKDQEVFVVLTFRKPLQLPVEGFRIFAQQQKLIKSRVNQFIANNPELEAVEVKELRFDPSPKDNTELEMIEYLTKVIHTYTKDGPAASSPSAGP
ncbi:hypothetical protein BGZ76_003081, partial [Entomortierella beljakovae]